MNDLLVRPCALMEPQDVTDAAEVMDRRRECGKTYCIGERHYRASSRRGAVHYKVDYNDPREPWKEIDLTIDEQGSVNAAPFTLQAFADRVGFSYQSRRSGGTVAVELVEIGGSPVDNLRFSVRRNGNQWFWDNVGTDLDMKLQLRPLNAEIFKSCNTPSAPRRFRWRISGDESAHLFRRSTAGWDASDRRLEINTTEIPIDGSSFYYDEEWTGRVGTVIDRKTRQKEWTSDPVYPALIDASTSENIVADADDGYERVLTTGWANYYAGAPLGGLKVWPAGFYGGGSAYHGGLRFQTLGVPQGATINSATITLLARYRNNGVAGGVPLKIYGDDVDTAAAWSNGNLPSGITKTTAAVNFTPNVGIGSGPISSTFTPGITSIVQEIVSRAGWASGNNIRFAFLAQSTGVQNSVWFYDYAQGQPSAAQLDIDYTAGRIPKPPAAYNNLAIY